MLFLEVFFFHKVFRFWLKINFKIYWFPKLIMIWVLIFLITAQIRNYNETKRQSKCEVIDAKLIKT